MDQMNQKHMDAWMFQFILEKPDHQMKPLCHSRLVKEEAP